MNALEIIVVVLVAINLIAVAIAKIGERRALDRIHRIIREYEERHP